MNRTELIQRLSLNAISDDFENVDQVIFRDAAGQAAKCGLTIGRSEVVDALKTLVETGMAKAYDLSASVRDPFLGELKRMPLLDVIEEDFKTCFYVTKKGMEFHLVDATEWPFDDEGELRPDWKPPST
jgi:hypothetical protein